MVGKAAGRPGKSQKTAKLPGFSPGYREAGEWERLGVPVQRAGGDLPRQDRETTIAFTDAEKFAEVNTCRRDWQRRLEAAGAAPWTIQVYAQSEAEFRSYVIPKGWIKKPYKSGRKDGNGN